MKFSIPEHHGLDEHILSDLNLVPRTAEGNPSLTDIQYEALANGVARGTSLLIISPTSTGKTLVGVWGLASWLTSGLSRHVVYLVQRHRQKIQGGRSQTLGMQGD